MTDGQPTRVALRPWAAADLPVMLRLLGDPALTEHVGGLETADQIERRHQTYLAMTDPADGAMFAVLIAPHQAAVGQVGYWEHVDDGQDPAWETGWFVLPEFHGRGVATAATRLVVEAAFAARRRPVHAYPNVANLASNAIARKAGFRLLGPREFEYPTGHWMTCNDWIIEPPGWPGPPDPG